MYIAYYLQELEQRQATYYFLANYSNYLCNRASTAVNLLKYNRLTTPVRIKKIPLE